MLPTHTLIYIIDDTKVCLGYKKRGHGDGYWNGFGGKIAADETVEEAAVREVAEESGLVIQPADLRKVAVSTFYYSNKTHVVETFFIDRWQGELVESEEMKPVWFYFNEIPYEEMWVTDKEWFPRVLSGEKLEGEAWFNDSRQPTKAHWKTVEQF